MRKINKLLTKINFSDANRKPGQIKYLVKHYCGAEGDANANCRYFASGYRGASAHYFVGYNGDIWQSVEDEDIAWHCGARVYKHPECRNTNSIGIEFCVKKDKDGRWYYTEETKAAGLELIRYLMDKYGIDENHVLRHYDVTGKICGEPDVRNNGKEWEKFKKEIKGHGRKKAAPGDKVGETAKPGNKTNATGHSEFKVKTTCDSLNIRLGAGIEYKAVGEIKEKEGSKKLYTITEVKNGWGRLKSGAGWIALAYTKKVE